jgi:hypothetical protein
MPSRREFLCWVSGALVIRRPEGRAGGTPVQKRDYPEESVQELIQQIRFLERSTGRRAHIQAIQDQIRMRLLLAGLACVYEEEDGKSYVCALETSTGNLWCLPWKQSAEPWACRAWERIGLGGLGGRIGDLPWACDI